MYVFNVKARTLLLRPQHNIHHSWGADKAHKYELWLKAFHSTNGIEIDFGNTYWSWKKKSTEAYLYSNSPATHDVYLAWKCFIWNRWILDLAGTGVHSVAYTLICNHIIKENCIEEKIKALLIHGYHSSGSWKCLVYTENQLSFNRRHLAVTKDLWNGSVTLEPARLKRLLRNNGQQQDTEHKNVTLNYGAVRFMKNIYVVYMLLF